MFKTLLTAAALTALVLGASLQLVAAEAAETKSTSLAGDELRKAIVGKTVFLKISGFELPISYAANGTMKGSMGAVAAAFSRGDGSSDRGKWRVSDGQLCQQWNSWMESKPYCYKLTLNGKAVRWVRNDGASGTARIG